jgi:hypothetical protein
MGRGGAAPMDGRQHGELRLNVELLRDLHTRWDGCQIELSPVMQKGEKIGDAGGMAYQ